ncbi:RadC family protein [Desulfolucanica intricata]|uniref:RadC family protein n=1 Tax=Desulfolucanica intricata TaxID=1285191 RepID=UPI0008325CC7|nr:DNA repair protein RadC [Desulfolucanica intricata]
MPIDLRPRERLLKDGVESLSDMELMAILLRTGTASVSAIELAAMLLSQFKGLRSILDATVEELSTVKGVGLAKAAQVKAALELGRRLASRPAEEKPCIKSPEDAAGLVMEDMRYLDREYFRALLLNTKNHVLGLETISIGTLNSSSVHPRELFRNAIKRSAAALILVHNHPSGDPTPSREDLAVTKRLEETGKIIGIEVLDHIIIGDNKFVSLKAKGLF